MACCWNTCWNTDVPFGFDCDVCTSCIGGLFINCTFLIGCCIVWGLWFVPDNGTDVDTIVGGFDVLNWNCLNWCGCDVVIISIE